MFTSIVETGNLTILSGIICTICSLVFGVIIAYTYMASSKETYSKNFVVSLVLLPVLVQGVIMMVNGNLGTSVAVLGAFSLVRFRSVPGSSKEICAIFFAMAVGLATGMGQVIFASMMVVIVGIVMFIVSVTRFGEKSSFTKTLKVTIPENLDYADVFDDVFEKYTDKYSLERVKTTNLGSMYELLYNINLKNDVNEKEFIDNIRCRNGNLTVICGRCLQAKDEL